MAVTIIYLVYDTSDDRNRLTPLVGLTIFVLGGYVFSKDRKAVIPLVVLVIGSKNNKACLADTLENCNLWVDTSVSVWFAHHSMGYWQEYFRMFWRQSDRLFRVRAEWCCFCLRGILNLRIRSLCIPGLLYNTIEFRLY